MVNKIEQFRSSAKDITGTRYGYLIAVEPVKTKSKILHWKVHCDCGKEKIVRGKDLRNGSVTSCGCKRSYAIKNTREYHGMTKHPVYAIWLSMRSRCRLSTDPAWHSYGGRGIKVCALWNESFIAFWQDMGESYKSGLTLDRLDNNGNYNARNCAWRTRIQQARNTRRNRIINTPWGLITISEAAEISGILKSTILFRLNLGWDSIIAVTKPPRPFKQ